MSPTGDEHANHHSPSEFATTHWSLVVRAGDRGDKQSAEALAALCERYWYPLYAYVRRHVNHVEEAQDLIQGFFARLLEKNTLAGVSVEGGRFRSFLLTAVKNYLANERDRAAAQKRGGDRQRLSLDFDAGESRLSLEPVDHLTAERLFERQWALTLLEVVMRRLEAEYAASGKTKQFEVLKDALTGSSERLPYATLGDELDLSEEAARQAASRLRKRYRELLREEVANTLAEPDDVDDEIRGLFAILG